MDTYPSSPAAAALTLPPGARSGRRRWLLGWFLVLTAVTTAIVGIVGGIVLSSALGRVHDTVGQTRQLLDQTAGVGRDTLDAVDGILGDTAQTVTQVQDALRTAASGLARISGPAGSASGSLADNSGAIADQLQQLSRALGDWQGRLSSIGGIIPVPTALADAVTPLRQQLDTLAGQIRASQGSLRDFGSVLATSGQTANRLVDDLGTLRQRLEDRGRLFDQYRATLEQARTLASGRLDRVSSDLNGGRAAIVLLGLLLAAGQLLPFLVGWNLVRTTTAGPPPGVAGPARPEVLPPPGPAAPAGTGASDGAVEEEWSSTT